MWFCANAITGLYPAVFAPGNRSGQSADQIIGVREKYTDRERRLQSGPRINQVAERRPRGWGSNWQILRGPCQVRKVRHRSKNLANGLRSCMIH